MNRRGWGLYVLLLLVVLPVVGGQIAAASDAIASREPASVAQQNGSDSFEDTCPNYVSIWRTPLTSEEDEIAVQFSTYVPDNASAFYVLSVDGERAAVRHFSQVGIGDGVNMDGASIRLSETTSGTHRVNLVVFNDTNRNEQFERGIDEECTVAGEIVQSGEEIVDFDKNRILTPTPTPRHIDPHPVPTLVGYVLAAVFVVLLSVMAFVVHQRGL